MEAIYHIPAGIKNLKKFIENHKWVVLIVLFLSGAIGMERGVGQCTVNAGPDVSICLGASTTLTATPDSATWNYHWTSVPVGTYPDQRSITVSPTSLTTYTVHVTSTTNGYTCSDNVVVTVNPLPTPTITGTTTVCQGPSGHIYSTQSGMTNYIWTITGGTITSGGTTSSSTATVTWTTAGTGHLYINYTNSNGCTAVTPTDYQVTVNPSPNADFTFTNPSCSETSVQFANISTPTSGVTYSWTFGDGGTSTSQNPNHTYNIAHGCNPGTTFNVTLIVTNTSNGCSNTKVIPIDINKIPNPQLQDQNIFSPFSNCINHPTPSNPDYTITVDNITQNTGCITS